MKKIIIQGAIPTNTLHMLKQEVPSDMDIIVIDEHQIANPNYYLIDSSGLIGVRNPEPKADSDVRKKRRKDFWNDLPKPKRRKR
ncbi:hypothetical protein HYP99_gp034 [Sinorhizobium phage ort11]|uniref:Uncharacterized protein n=1 Tax=Sinorhizobium phage ort11 TaxID=2599764 RepID=A0A5C2H5I8_9CAUD|nr:hypothetical protein HYP99_gp034 [Sinorhizobium phage ort11]QEP29832.1 hypothetical protein Smphiort11_034 [Sinorhizobium phage ort11]